VKRNFLPGDFREVVSVDELAYVVEREEPRRGARLLEVTPDLETREIIHFDDSCATDFVVTETAILWTEQPNPMQNAMYRHVSAVTRDGTDHWRPDYHEISMRRGLVPEERGGAIVSAGMFLARIDPAAKLMQKVHVVPPYTPRAAKESVALPVNVVSARGRVYWSMPFEPPEVPISRICSIARDGGAVRVEIESRSAGHELVTVTDEGIFFLADGALHLKDTAGAVTRLGECASGDGRIRARVHGADIWFQFEDCSRTFRRRLYVFRGARHRLETYPITTTGFDVSGRVVWIVTPEGLQRHAM
jgi:hypothetical protein